MKRYTLVATIFLLPLTPLTAGAHSSDPSIEKACMAGVQGKIAWDYKGSKKWGAKNLKALCAGTLNAKAPSKCFHTVMHRNISWGGGTQWDWKNALNLCAGTNNAMATVFCFQGGLKLGQTWQQAIKVCKAPKLAGKSYNQNNQPAVVNPGAGSSTINSEGNVVITDSDGTTREYFDGGMTVTPPGGEPLSSFFSTQAPAAIPPAVPDQTHNDWLEWHNHNLLNILKNAVNNDQTAIDNFLAYEGNELSVYESIQLRSKTISLLLP